MTLTQFRILIFVILLIIAGSLASKVYNSIVEKGQQMEQSVSYSISQDTI